MKTYQFSKEKESLTLVPLGGVGDVTKNMYVYEYGQDILLVDCGVGFPDEGMPGVDLIIPDVSYLLPRKEKIRGIILTHGHEDHMGALPYILPKLNVPVFASRLTAGLAQTKLDDFKLPHKIQVVYPPKPLSLGSFKIEFVRVTHSVPDSLALIIHTPLGIFCHAADFKFDWTPMDGRFPEVGKLAWAGERGVLCLLSDCLGAERSGYTPSEQTLEEAFEREIRNCRGKFIVTTQSSNIFRLQQAINTSLKYGRKVCFLGRSIEQSVDVAQKLGYLKVPKKEIVRVESLPKYQSKFITLLVTGSQGQPNSALVRMAHSRHPVKIQSEDRVVFSADPIPGNEKAIYSLIDMLAKLGAEVSYFDVSDDLHISGHGSASDLMLMIGLTKPNFLLPIGGTFRHMKQYAQLAQKMGYLKEKILLVEDGEKIQFTRDKKVRFTGKVEVKNIFVDGLGVGDIGEVVLRDRRAIAQDGIVVVIVPINQSTGEIAADPDIVSRGFVYMKESGQLIKEAQKVVKDSLSSQRGPVVDWQFIRSQIEGNLENFLYQQTKRRPMILPVVLEV